MRIAAERNRSALQVIEDGRFLVRGHLLVVHRRGEKRRELGDQARAELCFRNCLWLVGGCKLRERLPAREGGRKLGFADPEHRCGGGGELLLGDGDLNGTAAARSLAHT